MNPFDDSPHPDGIYFSADPKLIDAGFVIREIQHSYWGSWRSPVVILKSIDNSLCFGLYKRAIFDPNSTVPVKDEQIGFARVVTDYCTFAWICDVVITKAHRGHGLGKFLMRNMLEHPEVRERACLLTTHDAHELYAQLGFKPIQAMKWLPHSKAG